MSEIAKLGSNENVKLHLWETGSVVPRQNTPIHKLPEAMLQMATNHPRVTEVALPDDAEPQETEAEL